MAAPIKLRAEMSSDEVRAFARSSKDPGQVRRLLAIATILDGGSRSEAARIAGVTLQIVRDWVLRFNEAGISGLATRKAPGPRTILDDHHRRALEEVIMTGPILAVHDSPQTAHAGRHCFGKQDGAPDLGHAEKGRTLQRSCAGWGCLAGGSTTRLDARECEKTTT